MMTVSGAKDDTIHSGYRHHPEHIPSSFHSVLYDPIGVKKKGCRTIRSPTASSPKNDTYETLHAILNQIGRVCRE